MDIYHTGTWHNIIEHEIKLSEREKRQTAFRTLLPKDVLRKNGSQSQKLAEIFDI
jgi:hypothetical protein